MATKGRSHVRRILLKGINEASVAALRVLLFLLIELQIFHAQHISNSIQRKMTLPIHQNEIDSIMNLKIQVQIECQQSRMLEKLSTIFDNKMENMKRQLEDISSKTHESQVTVYW